MSINFKELLQKNIKDLLDGFDKLEINIYFVNSNFRRNDIYKIYKLAANKSDISETIKQSIKYIINETENRSFEKYDLEVSIDDTVQTISSETVLNGVTLIEKIKNISFDTDNILDDTVNLSTLKTIVIQLYNPMKDQTIYFFEKYIPVSAKFKRSTKFTLIGKTAKPFKEEIISLHSAVDAILLNDTYYVLNRRNFNSMFNYKDFFYKIIKDNQEMINNSGFMNNTEQFINDCMENGRQLPRLTKIILAEGFDKVLENKSKLPGIKEKYKLKFELDQDGRIEYKDKDCINDILNVLLEHYVISALTDREMLAKVIESYTIDNN